MDKNRFLRTAYGDDQAATTAGVVKFVQEVAQVGDGVIVVPVISNVKLSMLATTLGEQLAKQLIKQRSIQVGERTISLCGDATLKNFNRASVYLGLWSTTETIDKIEGLHNCRSLIWVTWLPKEADAWAKKHNPILI